MEPTVLDDINFINLEFWSCVNEIVIMEAWTNGAQSIGRYILYVLEVCIFANDIVIMEAWINGAYSIV